jgi:DNA-binding SARP family transcriptional activator
LAELRIQLLGGFRVAVGPSGGRSINESVWRRKKPAAVLKLLALAGSHRLHREQLEDQLWPELGQPAAAANLRKAVHLARRALEEVDAGHVLMSDADSVWLPRDDVRVDVDVFRDAMRRARRESDAEAYRQAVGVYAGELLPDDRYEEWVTAPREELALEYVAVLEELTGLLGSRGDLAQAVDVARMAVAADPLREHNGVALMRLLALAGRRTDAVRVYEQLRATLEDELGTAPGATAQRLFEEVRSHQTLEATLAADEWERVGDLRVLAGDATGAATAFESALAAIGTPADARVQRKLADAWLMGHRPERADPHLAAAELHAAGTPEEARVLRSRANEAWELGDIEKAQQYAERSLAVAVDLGTPGDVAAADEALAIVSHFTGAWREGLAAELDRLASDDAGPEVLARVFDMHHCIGQYHLYGDGLSDTVEDYARRILDKAEQAGAARAQAFAWCLLGESLLLQARWEEADGCLERSCDLHAGFGTRSGALPWQRRAELAACCGRYDESETAFLRAVAIATVSPMASHVWGRIHATRALSALEQGDPERAAAAVRAASAAVVRYGSCATCGALLNPVAAEAYAALGDADSAQAYAASASEVGEIFASSAWSAMADSSAAWVAAARGDSTTARDLHASAADLYRRAGQPYWAARAERGNAQGTPAS